nr:putative RNA-directed DNA polymerase, eukaryota, reverse transcriptase zinc-binding domain protein [Tanacetum cinerariifolium]
MYIFRYLQHTYFDDRSDMIGGGFISMRKQSWALDGDGWKWIFRDKKHQMEKSIENPYNKDLEKVASSFYIANFPDSVDARGLWKDEVKLAKTLANIWIGNHHVYAAGARFNRSQSQKFATKQGDAFSNNKSRHSAGKKTVKLNDTELISVKDTTKIVLVKLCIATKCKKFIDEDVIVEFNGESFDVHEDEHEQKGVKDQESVNEPVNEHEDVAELETENNEANHSDPSCPPGFEFLKSHLNHKQQMPSSPKTSNCSTSFARYRKKDFKGTSLLYVVFGDLNDVKNEAERYGSAFSRPKAQTFNSFIDDSGLLEIPMGGRTFTWMNKSVKKMSKLDRFLLSEDVLDDNKDLKAIVLEQLWSHHNPILLLSVKTDYGPSPFKFFSSWLQRKDIDEQRKKKEKNDFGYYESSVTLIVCNPWTSFKNFVSNGLWKVTRIVNFFHGILKQKIRRQSFQGIMLDGECISNSVFVKNAFLQFYKEKFQLHVPQVNYTSHSSFTSINIAESTDLERNVSSEEIKNAVWDCGSDKSPGPDGFSFLFLKRYWVLFKSNVELLVSDFFSSSKMPPGTNSAFITLIPKSAFISGRQILNGPLMLSETIDWFKYRKKKLMIFKVEFEMAYDSVNWNYLDYILQQCGFGQKWHGWVSECLKSARTSILINGSPTLEFSIKRGLRQGDPLSPFLFILIMEALHIAIKDAIHSDLISRVDVGNPSMQISHFSYADDVVLVTEWNRVQMDNILRVLNVFFLESGLHININKSNVFGIGVSSEEIKDMARLTGCLPGSVSFTYLGLLIGSNMNRLAYWNGLIEKFKSRLSNWKANLLPIGGRLTLVNAILGSIGIYYMSIFKVSESILSDIESLRAKFFWEGMQNPNA